MSNYLDMPLRDLETALLETKGVKATWIESHGVMGWVLNRGDVAVDNTVYPTKKAALNAGLDVE